MVLSRKYTRIVISLLLILASALIYYFNLSSRHKAIIKTNALYFCGIIESDWKKLNNNNELRIESPSFLIDAIYKSMEGPKGFQHFEINAEDESLMWMTGFDVKAKHTKSGIPISNDFICHMNLDYIEDEHHKRWKLYNRINRQSPRIISLSHGVESVEFPEGFGFPIFGNEKFLLVTQSLNHNVEDSIFQIKHDIIVNYRRDLNIKPLRPKTLFMMLPFDIDNPEKMNQNDTNACIPVETKNHTYFDKNGQALSGHWKIFPGKQTFSFDVTQQLGISDTVSIHQITPHLHPFAKTFQLNDLTANQVIYNCDIINHKNKIGLTKTPAYSSKKGILLYPNHKYELKLETNNTTNETQDMMASIFLFFYDREMDDKISEYFSSIKKGNSSNPH